MYVMNKKWDSITNIAQCTSVYVSPEHEIKAVPTGGGKAKIISCPAAPQKPRGQICCGQWRPYRLRWQQSAALPASRWPF